MEIKKQIPIGSEAFFGKLNKFRAIVYFYDGLGINEITTK